MKILYTLVLLTCAPTVFSQTTYVWNGGSSSAWATAANWLPIRSSAQTSDILVFQNSTTVTNVPDQTVSRIRITNGSSVLLQAATANNTLTISDSLNILSGGLTFGDNGTVLNVSIGSSGVVAVHGTITASTGTFSVTGSGKLILNSASPLARVSGSYTLASGNTLQFGVGQATAKIALANDLFTSAPTISTLVMNNGNGASLANQSITVNTAVQLTDGVLETNSTGRIIFASGATAPTESATSYIDGILETTKSVGTGALSFMGVELASGADNIGNVTVSRKTGTSGINNFSTSESIAVTWTISAQSQPASGRNISFSWTSVEDNGQDPALRFQVYRNEGSGWIPVGSLANLSQQNPVRITQAVTTTSFSDWTVSNESAPLPVTWKNFYGIAGDGGIDLAWQTASEENADFFAVEKLTGEKEFITIGEVQASGNSQELKEYAFTDETPSYGSNHYRLKQVDFDGKFSYSKIIEVSTEKLNTPYTTYPNPAREVINIHRNFDFAGNEKVVLSDLMGREILVKEWSKSRVMSIKNLSIGSGIYHLTVYGMKGRYNRIIVID